MRKYFSGLSLFVALAGILVLILGGFCLFGGGGVFAQQALSSGLLRSIRKIEFNLGILKNEAFLQLVEYGKKPDFPERGRANPFAAY